MYNGIGPPLELSDLAIRAKRGDRKAFDELYSVLRKPVEGIVKSMVCTTAGQGQGSVDDLVQEVFMKAYTALASLKDAEKLRQWIFQIARNRCRQWLSDNRRLETAVGDELIGILGTYCTTTTTTIPLDMVDLQVDLSRALSGMPEYYKAALNLHYIAGLPVPQVAQAMGTSVATAKWRIHTALKLCKLRLLKERSEQ